MKIFAILVILLTAVGVNAAPELKGNPEDLRGFLHPHKRLITLSESAEKTAYSDEALVHLVVTTEEDLMSEAMEENSRVRSSIEKRLSDLGIDAGDVNSSRFSSTPQYGWFGKKPDSYKVVNRMVVRIRSEKHLQGIAKIADENDKINLSQTIFEHSQKDEFQKQVKEMALQKVLAQKQYYEQALGIELTPVSFHDSPVPLLPTEGARTLRQAVADVGQSDGSLASLRKISSPSSQDTRDSFDEVTYRAQITVEFEVK